MKDRLILQKQMDIDLFKSEMCHTLKRLGDYEFIKEVINDNWVGYFWDKEWYFESLYTLAMIDYLTYIYHAPVYEPLDKYRQYKLSEPVFPFSMLLIDSIKRNDEQKQQALKECSEDECGRFFLKYNIVEKDIRDVV